MRKLFSIGLAVGVAAAVLTGCSSSSSTSPGSNSTSGFSLTATTPAAKGTVSEITWNMLREPASLDWIYDYDTGDGNSVLANMCENLMRQNPDGTIVPSLASAVSHPDDLTYVYTIRSGVKFSDGQTMTAQDVSFSLNRNLNAKPASYWSLWYPNVKSISATGADQVTVKLSKPDALFASLMATPAGGVGEQAYIQREGSKYGTAGGGVMCTGPYKLDKWVSGDSITMSANPYYWDQTLKPKVQTVKFTFLTDASAITTGLLNGSIDGTWEPPPASTKQLEAASTGKLYFNSSAFFEGIEMFSFDGALKNVKIRQALQALIPYQGIAKTVLAGTGTPAASIATPATWGYAKSTFQTAYSKLPPAKQDLAKAKRLLHEAGVPSQPIVVGVNADNQTDVDTLSAIQSAAQQIGLPFKIKAVPASTYDSVFYDPKARAGMDAAWVKTTPDIADPLEIFMGYYVFDLPPDYKNQGFIGPLFKALATADPQQRATYIAQAQASFMGNVQFGAVYSPYMEIFLGKRITGAPVSTYAQLYYPWAATLGAP